MLNILFRYESSGMEDALKAQICNSFPDKDTDAIFKVLNDYDQAYLIAREYFAYYFPMTTKTVVDYVNENNKGRIWQFITDAVFDEGIDALYRFYDTTAKKNGDILNRCSKNIGVSVSRRNNKDKLIKMLMTYRNQMASHYGNDFGIDSSRVSYDLPILLLERLRKDKVDFDKKYFNSNSLLDESILGSFLDMVPSVVSLLNVNLNKEAISKELRTYVNNIIKEGYKVSLI